MMLLFSQRGLRVVIGTPNMRSSDWECMTNAVWVSPIFPRRVKAVDKQDKCEEKPDTLGWDLWEYLSAYQGQGSALNQMCDPLNHLRIFSVSSCDVEFSSRFSCLVACDSFPHSFTNEYTCDAAYARCKRTTSET